MRKASELRKAKQVDSGSSVSFLDRFENAAPATSNFLRGAGYAAASIPMAALRLLSKATGEPSPAVDQFDKDRQQHPAKGFFGKAGEMGFDMATLGEGGPLRIALQGAAQHQVQAVGRGEKASIPEAAVDASLGAVLPGIGKSLFSKLPKAFGRKSLELFTNAPVKIEGGIHPPTEAGYQQALELGLIPINKTGRKAFAEAERRGIKDVQVPRDAKRANLLWDDGVRTNVRGAMKAAQNDIDSRTTGSRGLLPDELKAAQLELGNIRQAAKGAGLPARKHMDAGGWMDAPDAIEFRKMLDQTTKPQAEKVTNAKAIASRAARRAVENDIDIRVTGKPNEMDYRKVKKDMAELAPVLAAFGDKGNKNYSPLPEILSTVGGGMTALGTGMATGNPWAALAGGVIPLTTIAARRYPGISQIAYNAGKAAEKPLARKAGKMGQIGLRTMIFGDDE
jgi:hypothetical protein